MTEPLKQRNSLHLELSTQHFDSKPPRQTTSWLGRLIQWVKKLASTSKEHSQNIELKRFEEQTSLDNQGRLKQKFHDNYRIILSLKTGEVDRLKVDQGRLMRSLAPTTPSERAEVKDLIQQTYRQAWGKLIDAQHGYCIQEKALQDLNVLKDHLIAVYPEGIPKEDPEKPLSILTRTYQKRQDVPLPAELETLRTQQHQQATAAISSLAQQHLRHKDLEGLDKGMNPTQFISEKATGNKIAIAKSVNEMGLADEVAMQQGVEDPSVFHFLGGFHELLASHLNILLDSRLGIPLAVDKEDKTVHAFVRNVGNFHDFIEDRGRDALQHLPIVSAQRFVFAQLITRNKDCHGENILFTSSGDPVPIDFGRILDPDSPLRACYLEFACLDQPVNEEDRIFYANLDVEQTMNKLTSALKYKYSDQFKDPVTHRAIMTRLNLVKARLYMVKVGVEAGLNQRQLLALDLPPITPELEQIYHVFQEAGGWPNEDEETPSDLFGGASDDWFGGYLARKGFQAAWNRSFDPATQALDTGSFLREIGKEILAIKEIPPTDLYTAREKELYTTANYDWTDIPRLDLR